MANLIRARSWGQVKPPPGARVDWGHPTALGLRHAWIMHGDLAPRDIAREAWIAGNPAYTLSPGWGTAANIGTSPRAYAFTNTSYRPSTSGPPFSWMVLGYNTFATNYSSPVSDLQHAAGSGYELLFDLTGKVQFLKRAVAVIDSGFTVQSIPYAAVWTVGADNRVAFSVNGRFKQDTDVSAFTNSAADTDYYGLGLNIQSAAPGRISMVAVWDRRLTDDEAISLSFDPYQFVAPPGPKSLYVALNSVAAAPATTTNTGGVAFGPSTPYWERRPKRVRHRRFYQLAVFHTPAFLQKPIIFTIDEPRMTSRHHGKHETRSTLTHSTRTSSHGHRRTRMSTRAALHDRMRVIVGTRHRIT